MHPMRYTIVVSFVALFELVFGTGVEYCNSSDHHIERGRRLTLFRPSIFNIVRFSNDECYDGGNQSGTCYTPLECKAFGGSGTAMCARGYGTCCIISKSCHNATSQKVVYFKNPSYPSTDNQQNYCDLSIDVKDPDVCQIRLDLLDFQLDPPTQGQCLGDRLTITASKLATNTIPTLCGINRHSHIYINVPQDSKTSRSVSVLFVTNNNGPYRWHLKITQIECTKLDSTARTQRSFFGYVPEASLKVSVPAPLGCLQYFSGSSGVIESFNFGHYLSNLDYAICIERLPETCKVSFFSSDVDWSIDKVDTSKHNAGVGDVQCASDYVMIPGGSQDGEGVTFDRYCGGRLSFQKNSPQSAAVVSKANGPLVLRFHSDGTHSTENNVGFRIQFKQENSNCQSGKQMPFNLLFANTVRPLFSPFEYSNLQSNSENTILTRSNDKYLKI